MKKLLSFAFFLTVFPLHILHAQSNSTPSGLYQNLTLGVDSAQGRVTGYYKEIDEPPNQPHLECSFYLAGEKAGNKYAVQAWTPVDKKKVVAGELSFFTNENGRPAAALKLEENLSRDCTALKPNFTKGQGAPFDLKTGGAWTEVRVVAPSKTSYFQAPDSSSPARDSAKRGTVLTVTARRSEWLQVQADQKQKGWIQEADLYPVNPSAQPLQPAPVLAEKPAPPAPTPVAKSAPPVPPELPPASATEKKSEILFSELLKTTTSWDGKPLPLYPAGKPEITILRITIPPGAALPLHQHPVINAGVLLGGSLTVTTEDGHVLHLKAGDAIAEVVNTWHAGKNEGKTPAEILVVYAGVAGVPVSVKK